MGKRIIVLSDGTGNAAAKVWRTNVWRVFESLDLKSSDQVAVYDDGVGTSSFKPLAMLGGAFGVGLKRNVLGLYKFLCRNYKSQQDYQRLAAESGKSGNGGTFSNDEIFLFGFSRGAFTVRVLTGLVLNEGLVNYDSEADLELKARAAYRAYRTKRYKGWSVERPFRALRNLFATYTHDENQRRVEKIRFIGVWDTVAAYGSPIDEMTRGFSKYIWPLELADHSFNSERIVTARQALAVDEERTTFTPVLWDEPNRVLPNHPKGEPLLQVWFSGVHSNVGGGYPDDSLANVSLTWMMGEAADCDLRFKAEPVAEPDALKRAKSAQDKDGRLYDSRAGIGGYYRYGPRKIADYYPKPEDPKRVALIHESVLARTETGAHLYAPIGLPGQYALVKEDRTIHALGSKTCETPETAAQRHAVQESVWNVVWRRRAIYFLTVFASLYLAIYPLLRESFAFQEMATRLRFVSDTIQLIGAILPGAARRWVDGYARDPAWFLVWVSTIAFLIGYGSSLKSEINSRMRRIWNENLPNMPRMAHAVTSGRGWRLTWWIFLVALIYTALHQVIDRLSILQWLGLSEPWDSMLRTYSAFPVWLVIVFFLIFHFIPERAIEWLRTRKGYQWTLSFLKMKAAPFVFAILIAYGALAILNHVLFNVRDSFGCFCQHTSNEKGTLHSGNSGFGNSPTTIVIPLYDGGTTDANSLCFPTRLFAQRGKRYAISVRREPADEKWTFWGVEAFMSGQPISQMPWWKQPIMVMLFPFRRTFDRPWGSFIVRYGPTGTEESFLDREPPALDDDLVDPPNYQHEVVPAGGETLGEAWTAKRDGEIYVYLNKPVLGIWGIETWISKYLIPNTGKARLIIQRLN